MTNFENPNRCKNQNPQCLQIGNYGGYCWQHAPQEELNKIRKKRQLEEAAYIAYHDINIKPDALFPAQPGHKFTLVSETNTGYSFYKHNQYGKQIGIIAFSKKQLGVEQ